MSEERYYATGRRKTSVARVWLTPGEGSVTINKRSIDDYLKRETAKMIIRQPLELTETLGKFDIYVNVRGGGISGQAGAIKHGISRALLVVNPDFRPLLKKSGFLTRDSRVKERKKYGQPGARKSGFRLRFQPVGLTGRRVEPTARREGRSYPRSALGGFVKHPG
ncbi:MAG: 30S ribosomal protein S9 [Deltaproteobacteria bacterium]|nr:30S ribosomal protein S9 [Deltaproteobacteria bacterium]